jgi:hypothetical protein
MKLLFLKALVVILSGLILWLGATLARVENERYALETGLCRSEPVAPLSMKRCLKQVETRTGWWWHIFHALKG